MIVSQPSPLAAAPAFFASVVMLIVLFVVVFVVESFSERFITLRAASGFVPSSSIRRCPSGGSSSSQGASCVFMFLMVGSMIVVSLAFEGSRFVRRKPSLQTSDES